MKVLCKKYGYIVLLGINALLIYVYLFRMNVIPLGWDTQFHLNRIEELYRSIGSGHIFSSTGTYAFSQIGLAINRFYPYLFLYPFAILRGVISPIGAYNLCSFLLTLFSFLISYYAIKGIGYPRKLSFLFSVLYNNSGYLLLQISQRGDIAEYIALAFLPLIFMGGVKLFSSDSRKWLCLPIGMVCVAYTHILSVVIFSIFLFSWLVLNYKKITLVVIKRLSISIILVASACLPLIITMVWAKSKTPVIVPIVPDTLINEALNPSELAINSLNNAIPNSLLAVNVGFITFIVIICGLLVFKTKNQLLIKIESIGLVCLLLSTKLFPWFVFQKTPLHVIQFPWRFLGISTFCFSFAIMALINESLKKPKKLILMIYLVTCLITFSYMYQYTHISGEGIADNNNYTKIATTAVYTDYMPEQIMEGMNKAKEFRSQLNVHKHIIVINGKKMQLNDNQIIPQYNSIKYKVTGLEKHKVNRLTLPVLNYGKNYSTKGIKVANNKGETEVIFTPRKSTQMITIYLK